MCILVHARVIIIHKVVRHLFKVKASPLALSAEVLQCWFVVSEVSHLPPSVSAQCCCSFLPQLWLSHQLCSGTSYTTTGDPIHIAENTLSKKRNNKVNNEIK